MKSLTDGATLFDGHRLVARGTLAEVARAAHGCLGEQVSIFDDATGGPIDLDLRGSAEDVVARLSLADHSPRPARGRPKLGVVAREVTLLPRHWEWLSAQPGGASATLRRLVDQARREDTGAIARVTEAVYRVMTALAGDLPAYEEATRALFAGDLERFDRLVEAWPADIVGYLRDLTSPLRAPS